MDKRTKLTLGNVKFIADQIWQYKLVFNSWQDELRKLKKRLELFDDSQEDRYQSVIKPYKPKTKRIELKSVWGETSRIVPNFPSSNESLSFDYLINEMITDEKYHNYRQLRFEIYLPKESNNESSVLRLKKELINLRNNIPEEYGFAKQLLPVLGKLFNTKYEDIPQIGRYKLEFKNLSILEYQYFKSKGINFEDALRNRQIIRDLHAKYKSIINKHPNYYENAKKLEKDIAIENRNNKYPFTITFQWWNLDSMVKAFPQDSKDKSGIRKVRETIHLNYPNLLIFKTKEELYLQLGIKFIQAKLLDEASQKEFRKDFYNMYVSRKTTRYSISNQEDEMLFNTVIDNIKIVYSYRIGAFWKYIDSLLFHVLREDGRYFQSLVQKKDENESSAVDYALAKQSPKENYSVNEICEILGIKTDTLYKWIRRGKIHSAVKENGQWLFNSDAFEELAALSQKSNKRINWQYFENVVLFYMKEHNVSSENAKRSLRRIVERSKSKNKDAIKKFSYYFRYSALE